MDFKDRIAYAEFRIVVQASLVTGRPEERIGAVRIKILESVPQGYIVEQGGGAVELFPTANPSLVKIIFSGKQFDEYEIKYQASLKKSEKKSEKTAKKNQPKIALS